MNPVVRTVPIGPRSSRAASPARERHDEAGFDLALGAAAAAHAPRPAEVTPMPRGREDSRPRREEASAKARPAEDHDHGGNGQATGARQAAPAGSPARDGAGAGTTMASDATSAAGTDAQNASTPPPVADRGQDPATPQDARQAKASNSAPAPTPSAAAAVAPPPVPSTAALALLVGTSGGAMPDLAPVTPGRTNPEPQAGDVRQFAATIVAGAGDLAVRVLSLKEGPRSARVPVAVALATAEVASETNPLRAVETHAGAESQRPPNATESSTPGPAADASPPKQAPAAAAAIPAPPVRGDGTVPGGGQEDGGARRQREGAAPADAGEGTGTTSVAVSADSSRTAKGGEPVVTRGNTATATAQAAEDPRLEPMRRAADQVTLKFDGEDGLEGRLRITVRGDSVRASILSSHEGTLERLGGELGTLRRALSEQGFTTTRVAVHDMRATEANGTSDTRQSARDGEERRQGEPQRRSGQGRESRQGSGSEQGRRGPQEERRTE